MEVQNAIRKRASALQKNILIQKRKYFEYYVNGTNWKMSWEKELMDEYFLEKTKYPDNLSPSKL